LVIRKNELIIARKAVESSASKVSCNFRLYILAEARARLPGELCSSGLSELNTDLSSLDDRKLILIFADAFDKFRRLCPARVVVKWSGMVLLRAPLVETLLRVVLSR
jgi:hypothetical protein